ncbi:hypothetical protein ATCR1_15051 [Agrobacterium tumefaciens CCNWGS0286]|nr:hypothetical protein ATCR1_15051 [Agrobacterium tumefaciens CCNWGS0286]
MQNDKRIGRTFLGNLNRASLSHSQPHDDICYEVEENLREIKRVIEERADGLWDELPDDLIDLPMGDLVDRLMQKWHEAEERGGDCWRAKMENR